MKKHSLLLFLVFLTSCSNYLYVQQQKVDCSTLASVYVDTPDPRQECPPCAQRLVIYWNYSRCKFKHLFLRTHIVFADLSEEVFYKPIKKGKCSTHYYFPQDPCKPNSILTYKITVETPGGKIVDTWEHKFWVKIIHLSKED